MSDWSSIPLIRTALPGKAGFDDGDWVEADYLAEAGIRLIQTGNIGIGQFLDIPERSRFVTAQTFRALNCKWVRPGDLLICRLADPIGRTCQVPESVGDSITAVDCTIYRPDPAKMSARFALHWLNSARHLKAAQDVAGGSTRQRISRGNLGSLLIPQPPLREQLHVATVLDIVDEAIRKTEQIIAKLGQVKQGLLHDLLTRGIDDNGELRDPTRHPEQFKHSQLGLIPKSWAVERLARLTTVIVDGVHHTPTYVEQGVPFLTVQNLTRDEGISLEPRRHVSARAHAAYWKRADPGPGDVLVSKDGTLGVARVVPQGLPEFSIFVSIALLRPNVSLIRAELLKQFFETDSFERQLAHQSAGTGLKHIHLEHFREFLLTVPPMLEQERIVALLRSYTERLRCEKSGLSKLRLLKQGLMEDLLTGRVRVTPLLEATPP